MTEALALSVFSEADRQMCLRYQGAAGGLEAAALALYPFTNEILTRMRVSEVACTRDRRLLVHVVSHLEINKYVLMVTLFACLRKPFSYMYILSSPTFLLFVTTTTITTTTTTTTSIIPPTLA